MRIRSLFPVLFIVLIAACGGGTETASRAGASGTPAQGSTQKPAATTPAKGNVDCATIKKAAVELLSVQFLAQLKTADTIEQVKAKTIGNLDLGVFLSAMHDLHALDAYSSALGDPKAAIDFYEKAGQAAQVLFAADPITQADIDTYNQSVGTVTDFLGHQTAIAGAMSTAGC